MMFLCAPLLGALSDRFGRRPVLLISIAGSAADYLFQTFAPTLALLLVGRLINGMTAANFTTANAYVADVTPPEQRAKRFGLTGAAFGVGFVLGPPIGGILGHYHPRLPFALAAVLAIINVLYGLFVLPESHKKENRSPFSWKKTNPFGTLWVLSKFQGLLPLAGILAAVNLAMFSLHATWVLYTAYRFNWSTLDVGLSLGFVGVMTGMVQGGLTGRIVKKIGEYKTLYLGLALAAIGYTIYGLSPTGAVMYAGILFHSLSGIAGPAAQAIVTQRAGPKNQGLVQGALSSLSALAGIIAPLSATYLFHLFTENNAPLHLPGIPFLTGATLCLLGLLLALAIVRPPLTTPTESPIPA
jgi:DHA1 family tetracycline resistance protein-like MFS transporter